MPMLPLARLRALDFSTLLPHPLATLMLAEAGAEVIKIERPGAGDDVRRYQPFTESDNPNFALLSHGKSSIAVDLRDPASKEKLRRLIRHADVLVEQFLDPRWHDDANDLDGTINAVAEIIRSQTAEYRQQHFAGKDVCCSLVATLREARKSSHFAERGLFAQSVAFEGRTIAALPMPIVSAFRRTEQTLPYPERPGSLDGLLERELS